jgi:hypothetical protein
MRLAGVPVLVAEVAKKVARKSARIAHELPSVALAWERSPMKILQMRTIFRVLVARPRGFEPLTFGSVGRRSTRLRPSTLDDGCAIGSATDILSAFVL